MKSLSINQYSQRLLAILKLSLVFLISFPVTNVSANEEALYGPTAPTGSTFIRFFNNTNNGTQTAHIAGKALKRAKPYQAGAYQFFPANNYMVTIQGDERSFKFDANHYYTVYLNTSNSVAIAEGREFKSRKKALISLYNLSNKALNIKTANGKTSVIDTVAASSVGFREINAVKVSLAAFDGETKIQNALIVSLKRGKVFNLFATMDSSGQINLNWIQD